MVYFVGAGPGAADLLTLRGKKYLEQADLIIYAGSLVNPELLDYAGADCEILNSAYMNLEQVIHAIEQAEKEGKNTVRLHTGDPSLYGAIREQMVQLEKLGISYEVCPGVSSFCGAAASLNLEYTLPDVSQSVIITRTEGRTAVPESEQLSSLAAHQATMVLFLSAGLAKKTRQELLDGGYPPDTPVAVVYKATWPEEKIIRTTLAHMEEDMEQADILKTALIIVGRVLDSDFSLSRLYDKHFSTGFREGRL